MRLLVVSLIWFIYDFSAYSFSIYSSSWISIILGDSAPLWKSFGWSTLTNVFYLPGAIGGAFLSDAIGPRYALTIGVFLQACVGFLMAGFYGQLATSAHVAGFVVVYGYEQQVLLATHPANNTEVYSYRLEKQVLETTLASLRRRPQQPLSEGSIMPLRQHLAKSALLLEPICSQSSRATHLEEQTARAEAKIHSLSAPACAYSARPLHSFAYHRLVRIPSLPRISISDDIWRSTDGTRGRWGARNTNWVWKARQRSTPGQRLRKRRPELRWVSSSGILGFDTVFIVVYKRTTRLQMVYIWYLCMLPVGRCLVVLIGRSVATDSGTMGNDLVVWAANKLSPMCYGILASHPH